MIIISNLYGPPRTLGTAIILYVSKISNGTPTVPSLCLSETKKYGDSISAQFLNG